MTTKLTESVVVERLLGRVAGLDRPAGNERLKRLVQRIVADLCRTIEAFDVTPDEFWSAVDYVTRVGQANELGLLVPGLGLEHFLDLMIDEQEKRAGLTGGTPRTIEGPLYIPDAPIFDGEARLDQDHEPGETLFVEGHVRDLDGNPLAGAVVDVWHANTKGGYSHFDSSQSPYNLRRRIRTDAEGRYRFRSILPSGYSVPPDGPTQRLLDALGRHGQRPAHIHFFVEAPGFRRLTTQINLAGDAHLHDDFAFATRDELICETRRHTDPAEVRARGLSEPFSSLTFDFVLGREAARLPAAVVVRPHARVA